MRANRFRTLVQAFQLISGETLQRLLTAPNNRIAKFIQAKTGPIDIVARSLLVDAQSRAEPLRGTCGRQTAGGSRCGPGGARRAALEDLYWSLVTSHEFVIRR